MLSHIQVLAHPSSDYSFPSDHAVMTGAVAAGLMLVNRRLGLVTTAAAALLMAFTRVYIGAHWPADVLVGLIVGGVITVGGYKAIQRPAVAAVAFLVRTPLGPLLVASDPPTKSGRPRQHHGDS